MSAHVRKTAVPAKNSRKSQATRARIMQTATDFISERGSTDFQMNEISDRCNLSKGALYYYFIDKADLMDAIFDQVIGDLVEQVEEAVSTAHTPLETIAGIVKTLVKCIRSERPLVFAMVEELFLPEGIDLTSSGKRFSRVLELLELHLEDARREGLLKESLNSHLTAHAIAGACIYNALAFVEGYDYGKPTDDIVREYLMLIMEGAATEKGLEFIRSYEG